MATVKLTKFQVLFIESACSVKEAVIFLEDMTDEKFVKTYGVSKVRANKDIQGLLDLMIALQKTNHPTRE